VTVVESTLYRGHKNRHPPVHFNRTTGRFAAPDGAAFGVMYLGVSQYGSFMEMFDLASGPIFGIAAEDLARSCLCPVELTRPVRLVDVTSGRNLKQLSPRDDNSMSDGSYDVSRRWGAAFWAHPLAVDGILYRSRNAPESFSVALFDRAGDTLVTDCSRNLLRNDPALADILDYFDCPLI
jgi:hypothetical protein